MPNKENTDTQTEVTLTPKQRAKEERFNKLRTLLQEEKSEHLYTAIKDIFDVSIKKTTIETVDGVEATVCKRSGYMTPLSEMVNNGGRFSYSKESLLVLSEERERIAKINEDLSSKVEKATKVVTELAKEITKDNVDVASISEKLVKAKEELTKAKETYEKKAVKIKKVDELIKAGLFSENIKPWFKDGKLIRTIEQDTKPTDTKQDPKPTDTKQDTKPTSPKKGKNK